jgi:hypothetical protein
VAKTTPCTPGAPEVAVTARKSVFVSRPKSAAAANQDTEGEYGPSAVWSSTTDHSGGGSTQTNRSKSVF